MIRRNFPKQLAAFALAYSILAGSAIGFGRFDGGLTFVWPASALVIAVLYRLPVRRWPALLTVQVAVNSALTGWLGIGWAGALPISLVNGAEALIGASLLRRGHAPIAPMTDLHWFGRFVTAMIAGPLLLAPLAGGLIGLLGGDGAGNALRFATGHALGNLTLTPFALLVSGPAAMRQLFERLRKKRTDALIVTGLTTGVSLLVFWQTTFPALFLPVMVLVLATFRLGRTGAAVGLVQLTLIGGGFTMAGLGPMSLMHLGKGHQLQFLQFYLAATMATVVPIAADLTYRRKLWRQLKRSEADFRMLADHSTDMILRLGVDGIIRYASPSTERMTGWPVRALIGQKSRVLIDPGDLDATVREHHMTLALAGEPHRYAYRARTREGEARWYSTHARALLDDRGQPFELLAIVRDVTHQKAREHALVTAALTDTLTGLANRRALEDRVSALHAGEHCLALLDLDRFKSVNDTYGHEVGDAVLKGFAEMARRHLRSHDQMFRLGGEEFVVLLAHTSSEEAYALCERVRKLLAATPLRTPVGPLRVTMSGGVATVARGGLAEALKAADEALYRAKAGGRDQLLLAA